MVQQNNSPSINELLDQGFDLQYFNPSSEYPLKLEDDWYLKFIKGPIKVTNAPIVPKKPEVKIPKVPRLDLHQASGSLKGRNQQGTSKASTTIPTQEKTKKRPTVSEINDDDGNLSKSPSPVLELNTEIMQQVQNEVAKEVLNKHKSEVEEAIQKKVAVHVLKKVPKGYGPLQSLDFDEDKYLEKEELRRQKDREKVQRAANAHRRSNWK